MAGRGGIPHRPEPDRLIIIDQPLLPEGQHIGLGRQRVQGCPLGGQPPAGTAALSRWTRPFTRSQNSAQAASSSPKLPYSSRRFAAVGTRSALAIFTVASVPPLDSGSNGRQVCTVQP